MHPLDQLTVQEIETSVRVLKQHHAGKSLHIKFIENFEPVKAQLVPYLEAERAGNPIAPPPRKAHACYYVLEQRRAYEMWINISNEKVENHVGLPKGAHPPIDPVEAANGYELVKQSKLFQDALDKCGLTQEQKECIEVDGWMYGSDSKDAISQNYMYLVYMRDPKANHKDSNLYAFPLPVVPVYSLTEHKVVRIDWCATGGDAEDKAGTSYNIVAKNGKSILDDCRGNEYHPDLQPTLRSDLKPLHVTQPDGPSFQLNGNLIHWQKWRLRISFNPREGLVLHDLCFDGRSVAHRLSVSEMAVPYGDPRTPLHRKMAFDFGDCGGGRSANELNLGCDCLGTIKYFDGNLVTPSGEVDVKKSVICMHEQDDGILWKHTNYRTGNPAVTRRRILVLQTILTVGNYEYIFAWHLDQAAGVKLTITATGIVSTQYLAKGCTSKYGNVVSPCANAVIHQHIFNLRADMAVDGYQNTVQVSETHAEPWDEKHNPHGMGFSTTTKPVETSCAFDADLQTNRTVKIVNENKLNPISGKPVGYKFLGGKTALLYAQPGSVARERAAFATHHYWVTKHRDHEYYAGGVWTNQSSKEVGGVQDAVSRNENVRNDDPVFWASFGLTHNVRVEDFPVMPAETMMVELVPADFFERNPAVDVPPSTQLFNRSVDVMAKRTCHL